MKQSFFIFLIVLLASACTKKDGYTVEGRIENAKEATVYLQRMDLNRVVTIDSIKLNKKGKFEFSGERLKEPTFFLLKLSDKNYITLLADTIETIQVNADGNDLEKSYELRNSIGSVYVQILNRRLRKLNAGLDKLIADYQKIEPNDVEKAKQLEMQFQDSIQKHKDFVGELIMDYPRSFAGYYALFQRLNDNSYVMNVMDKKDQVYFATLGTSLNLFYPESERAKHLYDFVLKAKTKQQQAKLTEAVLNAAEPSGYPDIEEKDISGELVKLSSLKGKVTLVSFWASWDEASRKENNHLKKMYRKYNKRGFEIYQVSLDRSKVLWENAIKQDELPWINVSDLRYTESYPARLYNIRQIPANYLISKEGEIIGKNLFGNNSISVAPSFFNCATCHSIT